VSSVTLAGVSAAAAAVVAACARAAVDSNVNIDHSFDR
jgi:hypothetical protein